MTEQISGTLSDEKAPGAFKTISEVADMLGLQQHVLRFWESRFKQIKPLKMRGGRRYYRPDDVEIIITIRTLLYDEGYTIEGAKRALDNARKAGKAIREPMATQAALNSAVQRSVEVLQPKPAPVAKVMPAVTATQSAPVAAPKAPAATDKSALLKNLRDELLSIRSEISSLKAIAVA